MLEETKLHSFMIQKSFADKESGNVSKFIVLTKPGEKVFDWILINNFLEIISHYDGKGVLEYMLKFGSKGNPDEGIVQKLGKKLHLSVKGDTMNIAVYTGFTKETMELKHTHSIDKKIYDAYALTIKNDADVAEKEKEYKVKEKFSIHLD